VGVRRRPGTVGGVTVTHAEMPGRITSGSTENKQRQRNARDLYLRRTYGISLLDYDNLLDDQGGRCAICLCRPRTRSLAVDHDHITGRVRGLLCSRCNHGLLHFAQEDITILRRAIEYLLKHLEGNRDT
jgi:hypothetical protein